MWLSDEPRMENTEELYLSEQPESLKLPELSVLTARQTHAGTVNRDLVPWSLARKSENMAREILGLPSAQKQLSCCNIFYYPNYSGLSD